MTGFIEAANDEALGRIVHVKGSRARVQLASGNVAMAAGKAAPTVGAFLAIATARRRLVGMITEVSGLAPDGGQNGTRSASLDLIGEFRDEQEGLRFGRGVTSYPSLGDAVDLLTPAEIHTMFELPNANAISVGHLYHDSTIEARLDVDRLLQRHFAILGSTGVGKSSGVAVLLREVLAARLDVRVFAIDCHNEYGRCFGDLANVVSPRTTRLPFWLFNFEELIDVIFGGRGGVEDEIEILADLIPLAKARYGQYKSGNERLALKKTDRGAAGFSVDTPVPYLLADLVALIDERMGKLDNRASRMHHHRLTTRIETISGDARFDFMFANANVGGDTMADLLNQLFRIDAQGKPITVMQIAGIPAEVTDAVVSVLCRLAFDFGQWSEGAVPLLFVCEEAHRYASADHSLGFGPTRRALARIAKEGRKYGVYLGLVTQRAAELDPTIISQCATILAMRMSNERDQALLRSAVSDEAADLLAFLPTLGTREAIAFGEAVALPSRMTFKALPSETVPHGDRARQRSRVASAPMSLNDVQAVIDRWRRSANDKSGEGEPAVAADPAEVGLTRLSANNRLELARLKLLNR